MTPLTLSINLDARCTVCHGKGALRNGICLSCAGKAMGSQPLTHPTLIALRQRLITVRRMPNAR